MPRVRPRWWTELMVIVVVYGAYAVARLMARGDVATAVDNGLAILHLESSLWMHLEGPLNDLFTQEKWLGVPSSFVYASLHYIVTPAILVWLYRRRPVHYRLMRTWLLTSTLLGLIGFTLMPTSPPRLLPGEYGFVDSLSQYAGYGWWADDASAPSGMGDFTNQYAAMPSLHVGWSVWCGVALWHYGSRTPLVRALAVGYPLITTIVVMGTGNHYFFDALAGVVVMTAGLLLAGPLLRKLDRIKDRVGPAAGAEAAAPVPAPARAQVSARAQAQVSAQVPAQAQASANAPGHAPPRPAAAVDGSRLVHPQRGPVDGPAGPPRRADEPARHNGAAAGAQHGPSA
ncbi:phosphatase PAP2 family protein [Streptomyces sp. DSM 44917]|uniref:Phosphatase PAP2 family protein n=1 Tax=Streptomyces boetiae TaxID=3075541 RepID=A0ABU2L897_9ACTN|nr:phosphatase PAP2 family protein [Streptomyces sp. DSM 44917]MDT0307795.1 phosphatase PAP2 family protein [Streptomyces sp. DSM 44917]